VKHLIPEFDRLRRRFPDTFASSLVLPCVRRIQEDRGYVADSDIDDLAAYLDVPRVQIEEVLSYYTMFRRRPIGRWHLQMCRNISCSMRGSERLLAHLERTLGIAAGETTADGRITLSTVECLGSCGTAPVLMVNERYYELQSEPLLDVLLEELGKP
jgi:NADH-quinone oxidoreductase subunit E